MSTIFSTLRFKLSLDTNRVLQLEQTEDVIDFERAQGNIGELFQKVFGRLDHVRYMPLQAFPAVCKFYSAASDVDGVDVQKKVEIMLATLGNQDLVDDVGIPEDKVAEIKRLAIEIFGSSEQFKETLQAGIYPWMRIDEALSKLLKATGRDGERAQRLKEDKEYSTNFSPDKACAFCRQDVLDRQKIAGSTHHIVLAHPDPYDDNYHLMIVTKEHRQMPNDRTDNEIKDFYSVLAKIRLFAEKKFPGISFSVMTRVGPVAGQTVPHFHAHIVTSQKGPQSWMTNWKEELSGQPSSATKRLEEVKKSWEGLCV